MTDKILISNMNKRHPNVSGLARCTYIHTCVRTHACMDIQRQRDWQKKNNIPETIFWYLEELRTYESAWSSNSFFHTKNTFSCILHMSENTVIRVVLFRSCWNLQSNYFVYSLRYQNNNNIYYHVIGCDYRWVLGSWPDVLALLHFTVDYYTCTHRHTHTLTRGHTVVSTVTSSLPLLDSGFHQSTFPFL
jgi:hypothetical protein